MLEKTLHESLARYKEINKYAKKMITEQEAPLEDPMAADPAAAAADPALDPMADPGAADPMAADPAVDPELDPMAGEGEADPALDMGGEESMDDTEEIDITDLVNMTKSIKKDMEERDDGADAVLGKMDDVFRKLDDLEGKLSEMDKVFNKIDQLGDKIESIREKTPEEKLQLRSLDSYPFNKTTDEFFNEKLPEMEKSGKNEYVITPDEVDDYSKDEIKSSFNPDADEEEEMNNFKNNR